MPKTQNPRGFNPMTDLGSMARGMNDPAKGYVPSKRNRLNQPEADSSRWAFNRQKAIVDKLRSKK